MMGLSEELVVVISKTRNSTKPAIPAEQVLAILKINLICV